MTPLVLLILACSDNTPCYGPACMEPTGTSQTSTGDNTSSALPQGPEGTNAFLDVPQPKAPEWDIDEAISILLTNFETGVPNPFDLRHTYRDFMIEGEPDCPTHENQESTDWVGVWNSDCETPDGWYYYGGALYDEFQATDPYGTSIVIAMLASFELTDPQGYTFVGGGGFSLERSTFEGVTTVFSSLGGTYEYPMGNEWLANGLDTSVFVDISSDDSGMLLEMAGGVGYAGVDIYFYGNTFDTNTCDFLPEGIIGIRDPTGYWYQLAFEDCSECAQVTWNGQDLGEACIGVEVRDAMFELTTIMLNDTLD